MATVLDLLLKIRSDASGLKDLEKTLSKTAGSVGEFGAKLGVGMLGAQTASKLLESELRHVIENIDSIPGIPQETIDSIHRAKQSMSEARQQVDQWLAQGVTFFTQIGEGLGYLAGMLVYGQEAATNAYTESQRAADAAAASAKKAKEEQEAMAKAAKDSADAWKRFTDATSKRWASEKELATLGETPGARLDRLQAERDQLTKTFTTDSTDNAETSAKIAQLNLEIAKARADLDKQAAELVQKNLDAELEKLSTAEKLKKVKADLSAVENEQHGIKITDAKSEEKINELETKRLALNEKLAELTKQNADEQKKAIDDTIRGFEERAKRLQAERQIAQQRGDQVEVNRLLAEEKKTLEQIAVAYDAIAKNAPTEAERESAKERATTARSTSESLDKRTYKITSSEDNYKKLSDPTEHFQDVGNGMFGGLLDYLAQVGTLADQVANGIATTLSSAVSGITQGIMGWVNGTMTWRDALLNLRNQVFQSILQTIVQIGAQQLVNFIITKTGMIGIEALADTQRAQRVTKEKAATAANIGGKTAEAAATGISSMGLALVFGALAIALIMGAMGGFATGGYTAEGKKDEVAGVVHKGEWVAPKWMVEDERFGGMIAGLEAARRGEPGYSVGGFLGKIPKSLGWKTWGQALGSGGLFKSTTGGAFQRFQEKWNLLDGTQLYGKPDTQALVYDGKNWVNDTRGGGYSAAAVDAESTAGSSGSTSGGGSSDAGNKTVSVVMVDDRASAQRWMQSREGEAYIVSVVNRNGHKIRI